MYWVGKTKVERRKSGEDAGALAWVRKALGFEPDEAQARVLGTEGRRVILNCTRQWGKSTVTAAKAVHEAWVNPGSLTLVASPSGRQSGEMLRKAEGFARRLGVRPKGDGDNEISLAFPNGSRVVGLPGNEATVRGFSAVSLLVVDEASRVPDELYKAVRPMLAVSGGALWLMSTPYGKRGFFHETWEEAEGWEKVRVTARECPRIPAEFLAEEERAMGEQWFRQEYLCEFVDAASAVFDGELVEAAITRDVGPLEY